MYEDYLGNDTGSGHVAQTLVSKHAERSYKSTGNPTVPIGLSSLALSSLALWSLSAVEGIRCKCPEMSL